MAHGKNYISFILDDINKIKDFVGQISIEMYDYIESHIDSKFIIFYKHLTHSDLATFGKATRKNKLNKNLLYYINEEEMEKIEKKTDKPFQTAHQSCIGLRTQLYDIVGLPQPRESDPYLINDYMNVYLVNKNMEYFSSKYTKAVFDKLNKEISKKSEASWNFENLDIKLSEGNLTPIKLHVAVHGLGVEEDTDFHKIRHHLFKGDSILLLFEENSNEKNMYLLFEKNPIFYSLIGESNSSYVKYQQRLREKLINKVTGKENLYDKDSEDEVTRQQQALWRNMLANEMMAYTSEPREVFCPLTFIAADYDKVGTLFRASHIKAFSDPNTTNEEKYDVNNGILICANADALFDKHLITINQNKEIVFSYLIDDNYKLKSQLLLMQPIFKPIFNDERMKYLAYHEQVFNSLELERKNSK